MSRGDIVIVAAPGDYGKPRPAVVVQSDAIPKSHPSVVVCQMTSDLREADFRVLIEPRPANGLTARSQVMADKPATLKRERIGRKIGQLSEREMVRLQSAIAFVMGFAG